MALIKQLGITYIRSFGQEEQASHEKCDVCACARAFMLDIVCRRSTFSRH